MLQTLWVKRNNQCNTHLETGEVELDVVGLDMVGMVPGTVELDTADSLGIAEIPGRPSFTENGSL